MRTIYCNWPHCTGHKPNEGVCDHYSRACLVCCSSDAPCSRHISRPDDSAERKAAPLASGCFDYFPDALWEVARLSYFGNEKHNPGEPLHDARGKSADDADCLLRHFKDRGKWDTYELADGRTVKVRHSAAVAWRALRILQKECEADGAPLAPGARVPTTPKET